MPIRRLTATAIAQRRARISSTSNMSLTIARFVLPVFLISLACSSSSTGVVIEGQGHGQPEVIGPTLQQASVLRNSSPNPVAVIQTVAGQRVKRSRDVQQLCGYRLLDALRSLCDRNFVGFTRRSDPSFGVQPGDAQSADEDIAFSVTPWEGVEYSQPPFLLGGGTAASENPFGGVAPSGMTWDGNLIDYLELLQNPPSAPNPFMWPFSTSVRAIGGGDGGNGGGVRGVAGGSGGGSSKAFAMKILTEPPNTHHRFRRNIIDECCKKPCAMDQMLKYCGMSGVGKRSY